MIFDTPMPTGATSNANYKNLKYFHHFEIDLHGSVFPSEKKNEMQRG